MADNTRPPRNFATPRSRRKAVTRPNQDAGLATPPGSNTSRVHNATPEGIGGPQPSLGPVAMPETPVSAPRQPSTPSFTAVSQPNPGSGSPMNVDNIHSVQVTLSRHPTSSSVGLATSPPQQRRYNLRPRRTGGHGSPVLETQLSSPIERFHAQGPDEQPWTPGSRHGLAVHGDDQGPSSHILATNIFAGYGSNAISSSSSDRGPALQPPLLGPLLPPVGTLSSGHHMDDDPFSTPSGSRTHSDALRAPTVTQGTTGPSSTVAGRTGSPLPPFGASPFSAAGQHGDVGHVAAGAATAPDTSPAIAVLVAAPVEQQQLQQVLPLNRPVGRHRRRRSSRQARLLSGVGAWTQPPSTRRRRDRN